MKKYLIIVLINFLFPYGFISEDGINRLSYSFSIFRDNEEYYKWNDLVDPNDDELKKYNAYLYKTDFSLLLKDSYEISFIYLYNNSAIIDEAGMSSSLNAFALPTRKNHVFVKFNYHFKERDKFPLNLFFGIAYGENISYANSYKSLSYNIGFYKKFDTGNYPIIPYIEFINTSFINDDYISYYSNIKDSYFFTKIGLSINLPVETLDNSHHSDLIWINPSLTLNAKDIFIGFNLGLSHPFN